MRRFVLRGVLTGALLLAAGCGGSSSDQTGKFKTGFLAAVTQLKQTSHAIGLAIEHAPSRTDAQLASTFQGLAARWERQASELQTLKPPSSVATAFHTLTGATARVETDLKSVVTAADTHSPSAAQQAGSSLVRDILDAKSASTTITTKLGIS